MKAKLDKINQKIGGKQRSVSREDSDEGNKYYEISTHRAMQELEADQVTIEENPVDIVNRQKMELRAWNVRDMPRQQKEVNADLNFEKQLAETGKN